MLISYFKCFIQEMKYLNGSKKMKKNKRIKLFNSGVFLFCFTNIRRGLGKIVTKIATGVNYIFEKASSSIIQSTT